MQVCSLINIPLRYSEIKKLKTFLVFEQSSLARNRQLDEFVYIIC